jgi:hypothetical protein
MELSSPLMAQSWILLRGPFPAMMSPIEGEIHLFESPLAAHWFFLAGNVLLLWGQKEMHFVFLVLQRPWALLPCGIAFRAEGLSLRRLVWILIL